MLELLQSAWSGLDVAWWQAVAAAAALLIGSTIAGLTGFGFALVLVPILLLIFAPVTVVVVTTGLAVASGLPILIGDRRLISVRVVSPLIVPALVGLFLGVRLLTTLDTRLIKLAAGLVVVSFAVLVARGIVIPGIRSRIAPIIAGFVSGVLGTAIGMGGPPVALFLAQRAPEPRVFRASITAYFAAVNGVGLLLVARTGEAGRRELGLAIVLLPVALSGRWVGQRLHDRVDQAQFRRIVLGMLMVTGTSAILTALAGLL